MTLSVFSYFKTSLGFPIKFCIKGEYGRTSVILAMAETLFPASLMEHPQWKTCSVLVP